MNLRALAAIATAATALAGISIVNAPVASASTPASTQAWAPAETASIHPGTQTYTSGGQCTANFVFTDGAGAVYIGQAAHCSATGEATETNGCTASSRPLGTRVDVDGADHPGTMIYNSWLTMQEVGETDPNACAYNDFALIELDPRDHDKVNPSIPVWGGPVGIADGTGFGEQVFTFGNSSLRFGIETLSPKTGVSLGETGNGWSHPLYSVSPGIPGDSGSPFLDDNGDALGVLSTLALAPLAGSNNVSDLAAALDYLDAHTSLDIALEPGTVPFSGTSGITGVVG